MKLLLVSDKEEDYIWDHFDPQRFAGVDFIISCGDMRADYLSFLVTMVNRPLFYVPGNHDKTYLRQPPEGCESLDGKLTEYQGLRILGLGGSICYNSETYQYTEKEMSARIRKLMPRIRMKDGFDILVTHAPAFGLGDGKDHCHTGFQCFTDLIDQFQPRYHFHGHNHLEYGRFSRTMQHGATTIVNASGYYLLDTEKSLAEAVGK